MYIYIYICISRSFRANQKGLWTSSAAFLPPFLLLCKLPLSPPFAAALLGASTLLPNNAEHGSFVFTAIRKPTVVLGVLPLEPVVARYNSHRCLTRCGPTCGSGGGKVPSGRLLELEACAADRLRELHVCHVVSSSVHCCQCGLSTGCSLLGIAGTASLAVVVVGGTS